MLPADTLVDEQQQAQIQRVIRIVARRHRLSPDEHEDFAAHVQLKLLENDGAILKKCQHPDRFESYLVTVITRLFLDYRTAKWGRFRASARAQQLGPIAVLLERLVLRDRLTLQEAIALLQTNHGVQMTAAELEALYAELPRTPRRSFVDEEALANVADEADDGERQLREEEQREHATRTLASLHRAIEGLPTQDRLIVQMRYEQGQTIAQISRWLGLDQKPLYRRMKDIEKALKRQLEADGIVAKDVLDWLGDITPPDPDEDKDEDGDEEG